jgi:hypothetical protein
MKEKGETVTKQRGHKYTGVVAYEYEGGQVQTEKKGR